MLTQNWDTIRAYDNLILTPNDREFRQICERARLEASDNTVFEKLMSSFSPNTILVVKGAQDLVVQCSQSNGNNTPALML